MLFICGNSSCDQSLTPCEFTDEEMNTMLYRTTCCPIGYDDMTYEIDEVNAFFCLVVGSRDFNDYNYMKQKLDFMLQNKKDKDIVIVSGGAKGADNLAEKYAIENHYKLLVFRADWNKLGKGAGYVRNTEMHKFIARQLDRGVVAFWDGKSKGTTHNFELAKKYNNQIKVYQYTK